MIKLVGAQKRIRVKKGRGGEREEKRKKGKKIEWLWRGKGRKCMYRESPRKTRRTLTEFRH